MDVSITLGNCEGTNFAREKNNLRNKIGWKCRLLGDSIIWPITCCHVKASNRLIIYETCVSYHRPIYSQEPERNKEDLPGKNLSREEKP